MRAALERAKAAARSNAGEYSRRNDPVDSARGWPKDKFGLSWQVVPDGMTEMLKDPDSEAASRTMTAMLQMKKLDLNELRRAYDA